MSTAQSHAGSGSGEPRDASANYTGDGTGRTGRAGTADGARLVGCGGGGGEEGRRRVVGPRREGRLVGSGGGGGRGSRVGCPALVYESHSRAAVSAPGRGGE